MLVEVWVRFVHLVIVSLIESVIANIQLQVRVRLTAEISGCEIAPIEHVHSNDTLLRPEQHFVQDSVAFQVCEKLGDLQVSDA